MQHDVKGKVAIVGVGEVPGGKYPERSAVTAASLVIEEALEDAHMSKGEIDVLLPAHSLHSRDFDRWLGVGGLVEMLGIQPHMNLRIYSGGATGSGALEIATGLISAKLARTVLCLHVDKVASSTEESGKQLIFADADWELPFGYITHALGALITQRYMYETGTSEEEMASVCVALRKWAELNPNAMYRTPLTIKEVLASRMSASPLHAFEIPRLADRGVAFIVTSAEIARDICESPVYLLGTGGCVCHYSLSQSKDITRFQVPEVAKAAYEMAGIGPEDLDAVEFYDAYPVVPLIFLEGLGCCPRGEAGRFVFEGNTWPGGKLPMTTNGGLLSGGHSGAGGGFDVLVEAVRQLKGKAGKRQVENAKIIAQASIGGPFSNLHVAILGREIP